MGYFPGVICLTLVGRSRIFFFQVYNSNNNYDHDDDDDDNNDDGDNDIDLFFLSPANDYSSFF